MATDYVDVVHSDKFAKGQPLDGVSKSFRGNLHGLVVGSKETDMNTLRGNNFC